MSSAKHKIHATTSFGRSAKVSEVIPASEITPQATATDYLSVEYTHAETGETGHAFAVRIVSRPERTITDMHQDNQPVNG